MNFLRKDCTLKIVLLIIDKHKLLLGVDTIVNLNFDIGIVTKYI